MRRLSILAVLLTLPACHGSGDGSDPEAAVPMLLAAGMESIDPAPADAISSRIDLPRLAIAEVERVWELSTPAGEVFAFDVLAQGTGAAGPVRIAVAHALDGDEVPRGNAETIAAAGCVVNATGLGTRPPWLEANGEGFARLTISGAIAREQVLALRTETAAGKTERLVRISIGARSAINAAADGRGDHPGVVDRQTLYSSDSWSFGLPTIAVSGDRTSVVAYEGDRATWQSERRYEMRLQHDAATGTVTGGGSEEASLDSGHWRDHELAALYNVLALVHCGDGTVTAKLSYDRGATFAQVEQLVTDSWSTRLAQIAIAADYSLAIVFARAAAADAQMELVLVEGRPAAYDGTGSPSWFAFDPPRVVHRAPRDATPLLIGAAWSDGGDLVIGYGFSRFEPGPDRTWISTTAFRCAVQPWGGELFDQLIDEDVLVGRDPSVAVLGSGASLRIFYAYEGPQGVRLRVSEDAGASWSAAELMGTAGAHTPTVFARARGEATRVDVLYLANAGAGTELHASRWLDWGTSPREDYRLATATMVPTLSTGGPMNPALGWLPYGQRITQVAWFGYDAVLDGDEIVVVYDQETFDAAFVCFGAPGLLAGSGLTSTGGVASPNFTPATPPPLAPGMTEPMPAPDVAHRHQLELVRLD